MTHFKAYFYEALAAVILFAPFVLGFIIYGKLQGWN